MTTLVKTLIALAAMAFGFAVLGNFTGAILQTSPEAFSRASTNLALLAIALHLVFGGPVMAGRSSTIA